MPALFGESHDSLSMLISSRRPQVHSLCTGFPSPEFYVSEAAAQEAIRLGKQFNVLHPASGNKIDFMIAAFDEWGRRQLERRCTALLFPDRTGCVASPEDVIISKMRYYQEGGSEKHLRDIAGIARVQGPRLDCDYIEHWAKRLAVDAVWEAVVRRLQKD